MRIIITGACGVIGRVIAKSLSNDNSLCLLDIKSPEEIKDRELECVATKHQFAKIDIADQNKIQYVMRDFNPDVLIHLAAVLGRQTPWEQILLSNLGGAVTIFESSRLEGVKKVIYASTNNIYGGYEEEALRSGMPLHLQTHPPLLSENIAPKPDSRYAVAKLMVEQYASYMTSHLGLKTIGLRIGTVRELDNPNLQENEKESVPRFRVTWLYHQDLIQLVNLCLTTNAVGVYNAISGLPGAPGVFIDITKAIKELGYMPSKGGTNGR